MKEKIKQNIKCVYGDDSEILDRQTKRIESVCNNFKELFGSQEFRIFSTPGRTEISGNHTDHNNGKVIAAAVNIDTVGAVSRISERTAALYSQEYGRLFEIDTTDLDIRGEEKGSTAALMRGILKGFKDHGFSIGGFVGYIQSDVQVGSGLSSSASIEVLIGTILNELYNNGKVESLDIARIGQYAENKYFGKPCGLMDQIACAYGNIVGIDFADRNNPIITDLDLDLSRYAYSLLIVETGGNHADLTHEYAAIPEEMLMVSEAMGKKNCREITKAELYTNIPRLRSIIQERPILRALHFIEENARVDKQMEFIKQGRFDDFLNLVNESGNSSLKLLQNIYPACNAREQPITLGIILTEQFISSIGEGAVRIHGGGFAGTYQVFLPEKYISQYIEMIEPLFGKGSVRNLAIRKHGAFVIL
jgi:galactokinase